MSIVNVSSFIINYTYLSSCWNKTIKNKDSSINVEDLCYKVPYYLNKVWKRNPKRALKNLTKLWDKHRSEQIYDIMILNSYQLWVYNKRRGDPLPNSQQDLERLFSFVDFVIEYMYQKYPPVQKYLRDNMVVACCYMIWMLTTPNYVMISDENIWTNILLSTKPVLKREKIEPSKIQQVI